MELVAFTPLIFVLQKKVNKDFAALLSRFLSVVVITCPSHGQGRRFDPGRNQYIRFFFFFFFIQNNFFYPLEFRSATRSYGVMVSTLDSESSDPSSNLGRT
jgi:hypothetical protein